MLEADFGTQGNTSGVALPAVSSTSAPKLLSIQQNGLQARVQDKHSLLLAGKGTLSQATAKPCAQERITNWISLTRICLMRQCKGCSTADGKVEHQHLSWEITVKGCILQRHSAGKSPALTSDCIPVRTTFDRDKDISSRSSTHSWALSGFIWSPA